MSDDSNPCTTDSCDPATGAVSHVSVPAGSSCTDWDPCNGEETCDSSAACQPGVPVAIDDGNPCTDDFCEIDYEDWPWTGYATHAVVSGRACPDGDSCNGAETCDALGACVAGTPLSADDGNACTADSCDPQTGVVTHTWVSTEDENDCTADECDPLTGVISHWPVAQWSDCTPLATCHGRPVCDASATCICDMNEDPVEEDSEPCSYRGVTNAPECNPHRPTPVPYAIFATGQVVIGEGASVSGNVNALGLGLTPPTYAVTLAAGATVATTSSVFAPNAFLGDGAQVGNLITDAVAGNGTYAAITPYAVPVSPPPISAPFTEGLPVHVTTFEVLPPATYAAVTVVAGATLVLSGGEYVFESLTVGASASIQVDAASRVVAGRVDIGDGAEIIPSGSSGHLLNLLLVSNATDEIDGTPAVRVGSGAEVTALIHAMEGTVELRDGTLNGSISSKNANLGGYAVVEATGSNMAYYPPNPCSYLEVTLVDGKAVQIGHTVSVDDGNACTADSCSIFTGISHKPLRVSASCSLTNHPNPCADPSPPGECLQVDGQLTCVAGGGHSQFGTHWGVKMGVDKTTDMTIAPGRELIAAGRNTKFFWFDRMHLSDLVLSLDGKQLFGSFWDPTKAWNINKQMGFTQADPVQCVSAWAQVPGSTDGSCGETSCINKSFEGRVAYDCKRSRWIVQAALKNPLKKQPKCIGFCLAWPTGTEPPLCFDDDECPTSNQCVLQGPLDDCGTNCDNRMRSNDAAIRALTRRVTVYAVSNTEDPGDGFRLFWMPALDFHDQPSMGVTDRYLVSSWINGENEEPGEDPVFIQLALIDQIMNGTAPEGKLSAYTFTRSELGFQPTVKVGFVPVIDRGPINCSTASNCPVSGAALLVQEAAAIYTNPALKKETGGTLRLWALFPPEGNVHGRPVLSHAEIPAKGSDNVRAAALHDSMLHYVSQKNGKLYYGIVPVVASVVEGQPRIGFVGYEVEPIEIAVDNNSAKNDRPTLDVTANGSAIITYSYVHANGTRRSLGMAVVKLQNGVPVVVKSDRGFGMGVEEAVDAWKQLDYTGTARDPLYAEQVWFAQPVTGDPKREFWSGVVNSSP